VDPFECLTFLLQSLSEPHACPFVMLPAKQRSILLAKGIAKELHRNVNYVSRLFQPQNFVPKDSQLKKEDCLSKSQKVALFALLQLYWILPEHSEINHLKIIGTQRSKIVGTVAVHS